MSEMILKALQALTIASAQTGFGDGSLGPAEEEALAQLDGGPAPYPAFAAFLHQIAAGQPAPIPGGLPVELREWLESMMRCRLPPETPFLLVGEIDFPGRLHVLA